MRAKVIVIALGLALALLAPALYFHLKPDSPAAPVEQVAVAPSAAAAPAAVPSILKRVGRSHIQEEGLPDRPAAPDASVMDHDTYVLQRSAKLTELGMTSDPANLKIILSEMENPDPDIRQTALNATVQFGSQDAIPVLQNEMNWASDPQEKLDIKKAIDFLQLPHLGDDSSAWAQQPIGDTAPAAN